MNKPDIKTFMKNTKLTLSKHSPEILMAIGITGMISTTVLAVKATPKAVQLMEDKKKEEQLTELTPVEIVKTTWKCYIPAGVTGAVSIACLIGSNSVNARRNAAIATAYKLSEAALSEYKEKVVEVIGEKKEQTVRDKIAKDRVEKNPVSKSEVIIINKGNTLCLDYFSGRYFESDIDLIKKAENKINRRLINEMYISLNEFYDELGLEHTQVGNDLGWNIDDGLIEIDLNAQMTDKGQPCIVLDYNIAPKHDYSRLL